ncbi:MAG TPA: 2-oxo-4-hydroxy-4-carboxy-5-ureidoimidazoline decarboxylase [Bryobacteraceae bacterium]|jgi:OHCU decarboxylase|nr:2-oxo-4-hydroxy-4-carboxy-5-ureidoimidazoline decarboxylase [Bryobacteraceae bacterium]
MTLNELNVLPRYRAEDELLKCCSSTAWAQWMARRRPFANPDRLLDAAGEIWWRLDPEDWMQAFRAHPQIGQRQSTAHKSTQAQAWSAQEQSGIGHADPEVTTDLEEANREYLSKFGYIFIVCASGKNAEEMLAILRSRLSNSAEQEIRVAAEEQNKITLLRLQKLMTA